MAEQMTLDEIVDNFGLIDDWDERYRYLIELGRSLEPLPEAARVEANRVRGCASQVWLLSRMEERDGQRLFFTGDSDAHIVRGLVALTLAIFSGRTPQDIVATDPFPVFESLGLSQHLTPQRSNGVRSMVERIRADAREHLAAQH
jgi:cysteine desulfuration protein SufE